MSQYLDHSKNLIPSFKGSKAHLLATEIMNDRDKYSDLKIDSGSSRDVYKIGSFIAGADEKYAVLKLPKKMMSFSEIAFEAYFFNECQKQAEIKTPDFIMFQKQGLYYGTVLEDFSENGKFLVDEVNNVRWDDDLAFLKTDKTYLREKFEFMHHIIKITPFFKNERDVLFYLNALGQRELETTIFAVHYNNECKRVVCADVDQLYSSLRRNVSWSQITHLEELIFE